MIIPFGKYKSKEKAMKKYILVLLPLLLIIVTGTFVYETNKVKSNKKEIASQDIQIDERNPIKDDKKFGDSCCKQLTSGHYSDASIYQLNSVWKDQSGKEVKLSSFLGKKVVLVMFYTSCTTACPILVNDLQRLNAEIPRGELNKYHFVLVSIDPNKDTPERLKKYAEERNLNLGNWTLITGSKYQIAELAQILGFKYKKNRSGMFTHSNLITFINAKGEIQNQSEGLNQNVNMLYSILNK